MSTGERNTQARELPVTESADETTEVETAEAAAPGASDAVEGGPTNAEKVSKPAASSMRDAAMARVAPRQDLSARRSASARTAGAAGAAGGSAAAASAGRPRAEGGPQSSAQRSDARKRRPTGPRRVRLTIQRIDPWSVFKISLLVAVGLGIATVIMVAVLWTVLSGMNVFNTINAFIVQVTSGEDSANQFDLMQYIGLGRVLSLTVVFAVANVLLLTALATLGAFLYNVCAALVGGAHLTLSDE